MKHNRHKKTALLLGACTLGILSTHAARLSDPGQISQEIVEKPIEFLTTSAHIEGEAEPSSFTDQQGTTHMIQNVILKGNRVLSNEDLQPLYESVIGKEVSFRDLQRVANQITEKYLKAGYVLSSAIIPKQDISNGTVTIHVVEGYVDQISIEDPDHAVNERIQKYLDRILESRPLSRSVLEKSLILIQRVAGVQVQIFFKPSHKHPGASDLVVKLSRKKFQGAVLVNNDGTPSVGPWRATVQGKINNLTKHDDSLEISGVTTDNTKDVRAGFFTYSAPVGKQGTRLILGGNITKSKPSGNLESQFISSKSNGMQLLVDHPLILERDQLLTANAGVSFSNSTSNSPIAVSHYRDKFRSLVASANYELSDRFLGSNLVQLALEYGLRAFGATATPGTNRSVARGTANFVTTNLTLSRLQHLEKWIPNTSLFAIVQGQLASATLLSSKQFGIGGAPYNRAYMPYAVTGDSGFQGRLEARYSKDIPHHIFNNYMLYGYYTYGRVWNRSPSSDEDKTASAPGVGAGVRMLISNSVTWYFEYARPLTDMINGSPNKDKFYTGISYYF